jgi:hypothetical protein
MPAERTTMRQVREVLRLKFVGGVPTREIARRIGIAPSTLRDAGSPTSCRNVVSENDFHWLQPS